MIVLCTLAYLISGILSFIYWWTKEYDLTLNTLPTVFLMSLMGPFAFIVGWAIHGGMSSHPDRVLIKKRDKLNDNG